MRPIAQLLIVLAALAAAPAFADPGITVHYRDDFLRVTLDGSYAGAYYRIWRSGELVGVYDPLATQLTLCTGECSLTDQKVSPGKTYYYRFEILPPQGGTLSYGPYAVTIPDTPLGVRISPNPSHGSARIELSLPGSRRYDVPLAAQARIVDVQGRTVRLLHAGILGRGVTTIAWDGRSDAGQPLGAGLYFLRLATPIGTSTTRIVRFR
jgi:hypothetical protein